MINDGESHNRIVLAAHGFIGYLECFNLFGRLLGQHLDRRKLTHEVFAGMIYVSTDAVRNWMRESQHKSLPSGKTLYHIIEKLRMFPGEARRFERAYHVTREAKTLYELCREALEYGDFDAIIIRCDSFRHAVLVVAGTGWED